MVPVLNELIPDQEISAGEVPVVLSLGDFFGVEEVRDEAVRFFAEWQLLDGSEASAEIDFLLFRNRAPITVENFRSYVNRGDYTDMVVHRLVPDFVIQGGGFTVTGGPGEAPMVTEVPRLAPIMNEFGVSNTLATVSMAKLGGDPNSATSEWFISMGANSDNLDNQNGGFTVFGRVSRGTFANAQALNDSAGFTLFNLGGAFTSTPLVAGTTQASFEASRFYGFSSVSEVPIPAGEVGFSRDLSFSGVLLGGGAAVEMSVVGESLELGVPAVSQGGRRVLRVQAVDVVGNEVVDDFEVLVRADYESWRRAVFSAGDATDDFISGPLADSNGDGVSNFLVFLQGLSVTDDVSELVRQPSFNFLDDSLRVEFDTAFVAGVDYRLEMSDDLLQWDEVAVNEVTSNGVSGTRVELTSSLDVATLGKGFFRVRYFLD